MTEYTYYPDGSLETLIVHIDATTTAVTRMEYDAVGNLIKVTDPEGNTIEMTYDIMGNMLTRKDGRGKVWQHGYDAIGRVISLTDPLGNTTQRVYNAAGNLEKVIDPNLHETTYQYDVQNHAIHITNGAGTSTFTYNANDNLIRQTDPEGRQLFYEYDDNGRRIKISDGNGNEIRVEYVPLSGSSSSCPSCSGGRTNQPSRIIYPTFTREFRYDKRGRTIEVIDHLDSETFTTSLEYDPAGNLISRTDPEKQTTTHAYDALNRRISLTDAIGQTTYTYDTVGNLTALTDANGQATTFTYDTVGNLLKEIRPLGQTTTYTYDEAGNVIERRDAQGRTTTYTYDDAGRLTGISYENGSIITFTYDNIGNLTRYDDGLTSAVYTYDVLGRKIKETLDYGTFTKTFAYTYYANGLKKTSTMPDSTTYTYTYDTSNRLTSISIPNLGQITYNSYTWNRPDGVTFPGGSKREYTYDPLMRIHTMTSKDPGQNLLLQHRYTYDGMNNVLSNDTEQGMYTYTYDALSRLTHVAGDIPEQDATIFTYDAVGNRKTNTGVDGEWMYNENNELLAFANVEYTYDEHGNMTQMRRDGQVIFTYAYNLEHRLVRIENDSGTVIAEYAYDPFGRRLWKKVSGVRTYFLYADEGLVGEYDATGNEIRAYGYRPHSTWATAPLFMKQEGEYYFYHNDRLGTPMKLAAVNGAVVWSARYQSFGDATVEVSTVSNPLRFPGQYYDAETGLHYNWSRYYEPKTGRYLNPDPIGFLGGDVNLYRYCGNNPVGYRDIDGRQNSGAIPGTDPNSVHTVGGECMLDIVIGHYSQTPYVYIVPPNSGVIFIGCCVGGCDEYTTAKGRTFYDVPPKEGLTPLSWVATIELRRPLDGPVLDPEGRPEECPPGKKSTCVSRLKKNSQDPENILCHIVMENRRAECACWKWDCPSITVSFICYGDFNAPYIRRVFCDYSRLIKCNEVKAQQEQPDYCLRRRPFEECPTDWEP